MTDQAPQSEGIVQARRVLVLGGSGMLGSSVVSEFASRRWFVTSPSHKDLDFTWPQHLENLRKHGYGEFDWVVNCAAYSNVDGSESNAMHAMKMNGVAPGSVAAVCASNGWRFLHISSDFVFDGETDVPYTEDRMPNPLGTYGRSKLLGEQNVMREAPSSVIVRTAWLFGPKGKCFPRSIIEAWLDGKELRVVADQTGSPTYTGDLARVLGDMIERNVEAGIYHAVGPDIMTWHALAELSISAYREVLGLTKEVSVQAITSAEWPTPARRPRYSALSTARLDGLQIASMRGTKEALTEFSQRL